MKTSSMIFSGILSAAFILFSGCTQNQNAMEQAVSPVEHAIAVLHPTEGSSVTGTVTFTKVQGGVKVVAEINGLTPGKHGFHIHEYGDISSPDGKSAGGHFNPFNKKHGAPTDTERHVGDLGNVVADESGHAHYEWVDPLIQLSGINSIIGRAIVVHHGEDDLHTQPTGNAGSRIGCGIIKVDEKNPSV